MSFQQHPPDYLWRTPNTEGVGELEPNTFGVQGCAFSGQVEISNYPLPRAGLCYPLLAQSKRPAYFCFMVNLRCAKCGAEIVPGTNFCRACGAPVEPQPAPSEMQTAVLDEKVVRKTQRFEARTTAEASDARAVRTHLAAAAPSSPEPAPSAPAWFSKKLLITAIILLTLLAVVALVAVRKAVRHSKTQTQVSQQFNYPGARTVVNVGSEGGAVLQMETTDPLEKVSAWYASTLKPTKTLQVNTATVIMKNDQITVTLAATEQGTSIVIKQSAL